MSVRPALFGAFTAWLLLVGPGATAAELVPFRSETFASAQQAGRSILVHVTAPWCGICTTQKLTLKKLMQEPRFKDLSVLVIDFDTQKAAVRQVGARMQSTLITYEGGSETGRSVGENQPEWIEAVVEKAL